MQPLILMYNRMFQLGKKLTIVKYSTLLNNSFHPICIPTGENQKGRLQSSAVTTTTIQNMEVTSPGEEFLQAKPFDEMPKIGRAKLLWNFRPGGPYTNLDSDKLMLAFKDEVGSIGLIKGVFGRPDVVICHNPQDFETVYRNEGVWPNRPIMLVLYYYRSVLRNDFFQGIEGLGGTHGEKWGTFRSTVNPILLKPKNIQSYLPKLSQVNKEFVNRIREIRDPLSREVPENFAEEINCLTLESAAVIALDKQLGLFNKHHDNSESKLFFKSVTEYFTYLMELELKPSLWKYYKTPTMKKLIQSLDHVTEITSKYIEEAIVRIDKDADKSDYEKSVVEKLIQIDKKIAVVMAMDILAAGVHTTSSTLVSLLLCLAKNPEKQAKLREEIKKHLPSRDSEINEAVLKNMTYLKACLKESLRMYPLIPRNIRVLNNNVVLSGYEVPKGTHVVMVSGPLMQDETYFPRGKEFLPERWLRQSANSSDTFRECTRTLKPSSPFIYLPFGFGPRSCIGRRIAEMELEMCTARLIRNFHVEFNYPIDNPFRCTVISIPNIALKFQFTDVEN